MTQYDPTLFPFINDISEHKKDLLRTGVFQVEDFKKISFLVFRGLSQHLDCIMYLDEINTSSLSPEMKHDYLLAAIPARDRGKKAWAKKETSPEEIQALSRWFDVNLRRAEDIRELLSDEQVSTIVKKVRTIND